MSVDSGANKISDNLSKALVCHNLYFSTFALFHFLKYMQHGGMDS